MVARQCVLGVALLVSCGLFAATYNVTDFGANGSDSVSDRKAVQDALDKAKGASDTTVVMVPAGTYYLDRALFIYPNTRLSLSADAKFLRAGSSDRVMLLSRHLLADGSECPADETCTHGGHSQFSNIVVDGGTWDAASSDQEVTGILRLSHGSNLTIENVRFQGCTDHMLNISGSSDVLVRGCVFTSPVGYAGTDPAVWAPCDVGDTFRYNTIESIHMDFTDEEGEEGNYPHDGTACEHVTVTGCTFNGVFSGVGNHHASPGRFSTSLTVQDCDFKNLKAYAVDCYGMTNCVITRCTSTGGLGLVHSSQAQFSATSNRVESAGEHAFFLVHDTNARLTGNVVAGSGQGVNLVGARAELRGNSLSGCSDCGVRADEGSSVLARDNAVVAPAGYGFSFTSASSLSAVSNTVSRPGKGGIVMTGGGSAALTGNTMSSSVAVGIQLEDVSDATLLGNSITSPGSHGVWLKGCDDAVVLDNEIKKPQGGHGIIVQGGSAKVFRNEIAGDSNMKNGISAEDSAVLTACDNAIDGGQYGFCSTGASSLLAVSNTVSNSGMVGFVMTGGGSATLAENTVSSPASAGIKLEDAADAKILDNTIASPGSHGVWLKNCVDAVLSSNEIKDPKTGHGIIVQGGSAEVLGNEISCAFDNKNGISAEDSAVLTARGNSIVGGQYGFCATAGVSLVAEGNDVANTKNSAFYLANVSSPVVSENVIDTPGNCGVQLDKVAGAMVRGNRISIPCGRGVLMMNSSSCEVSGNMIDDAVQEGIYCRESTGAVISGNAVSDAAGIGIRVEGSSTAVASADVVGNRVQSSTTHDIRICDNCDSCSLTENICTGNAATIAYSVIGSTVYQPGDAPCSAERKDDGTIFVRWERLAPVSGYVNGYLLDYGDDADFSVCTTVEISDRDTVSYSLAPGSAQYVRVRSYHVYYGSVRYESTGSAGFDVQVGEAKVVFDDCEGTGGPGMLSVPFGIAVPQLLALPTRAGYAFEGYWTEPMGRGVNYVDADGVGTASVEPDWLPSRLYAFWTWAADAVDRPDVTVPHLTPEPDSDPEPDPTPDPNPAEIPALTPVSDPDPTPGPGPTPTPTPTPEPEPEPGPTPDPEPDPEYSAPQLYTTADTSSFAGNVTYVGWVRDATGALKGTLTVKIAKTNKKDGTCKPTISYIPFGGKKQTIKLDKSSYPVAGTKALLNIPGIGTLRLGGRSVMGVDVDVQAGADLTKLVETKAAAKARMAALAGVRTFALETEQGAAAFSVTVSKNGKGKLAGTLPDGTKVSLSAQGVLGGRVLAIPFAYSKKGSFGFVLWIGENGKTEISDMTSLRLASGRTLSAQLVAPSASHRLAPGTHSLGCELFAEPLPFVVEGSKWVLPRQNKRAVVDPNPYAAKLKFTEKTGIVKGSFSATPRGAAGVVKFTVNGVVVGSRFYGSAFNKGYGSLAVSAE